MKTLKNTIAAASLSLLVGLALTACGQSGPLYLPGNPSKVQAPLPKPVQTQSAGEKSGETKPADKNKKDDDKESDSKPGE